MHAVKERTFLAVTVHGNFQCLDKITKSAYHSGTVFAIEGIGRADTEPVNVVAFFFAAAFHKFPTIQISAPYLYSGYHGLCHFSLA